VRNKKSPIKNFKIPLAVQWSVQRILEVASKESVNDKETTMTQTTPTFEDASVVETDQPETDLDLEVNDDSNLDVDTPSDELDEVAPETAADASKPAKATSTPRTKAPDGFVKPVEFAKLLSIHLGKAVPPQVVYSYVKNNVGDGKKNPFPIHELDGYAWYIKPEEGLAWWDAKNSRVTASKEARAAKEAAKAATPTTEAEGTADETPVTEAE
jgi:hypothetical protein